MISIKRRLIIIANTGGVENYCGSVIEDRKNFLSFFCSPEGGSWLGNEIIAPEENTWTKQKLADVMDELEKDGLVNYWLIVFVGHGWENEEDSPYLELYPGSPLSDDLPVEWIRQRVSNSSCLLIADCCRNKIPLTESVRDSNSKVRTFSRGGKLGYNLRCRILYNQQIGKLRKGLFVMATASSFTESARNMPTEEGGLYSYHLLKCADDVIDKYRRSNDADHIVSLSHIHSLAKPMVIERSKGTQHPQLEYERGFQPPFCVIPKW